MVIGKLFKRDQVLCVGSAALDHFLTIEQSHEKIKAGDKVLVKSLERHSGGGATNSAIALSRLGIKTKILTKLGKDHDADFILRELQEHKVKNICLHRSNKPTDFSSVIYSEKDKDRVIYVHKGASTDLQVHDFKSADLKTEWIYLATLIDTSWETAKEIAHYALEHKIKLLFNPSLYLAEKGRNYLSEVLESTKILVLNKEEAQALLNDRRSSIQKLLQQFHLFGIEIVVITDGPRALYASDGYKIYVLYPPTIKVMDTTGAGDAFTSGILAGIIKNLSLEESLKLGQLNAQAVLRGHGTKDKLLNWKEALMLLKRNEIKVEIHEI